MGGAVSKVFGGGTGAEESQTRQQQTSRPVIIPRQPPVIPLLTTGQGSRISVTPTFATAAPVGGVGPAPSVEDFRTLVRPLPMGDTFVAGQQAAAASAERRAAEGRIQDFLSGRVSGEQPIMPDLTGLNIGVSIDPSIAENREQLQQNLTALQGTVTSTIEDVQAQVQQIQDLPLPEVDVAGFDQITEWGVQQRNQLMNVDTQLGNQIGQLEQMYERLGRNAGGFIEARTRDLVEQRERARRDAARRGVSGPLAALATNPFDTSIADESAKAQQDIETARLQVREQQRLLAETRLGVQRQFEEVRRGEMAAMSEQFSQEDRRLQAGIARGEGVAGLAQVIQGGQGLLRNIIEDQTGLNQQALQQEFAELGLGAEIYNMVIQSQLARPTAQVSQGTSRTDSRTQGDVIGDIGRVFGMVGGAFGG